ncbi:ribonuclease H-like domain-containing protein [Lasiosphaeris hirsuta]|uniref:Ribonuclease H-like domain-containing protein n=1 Tax=Lasiosphaeris hirsuta TaxID=260670 RepID=A0AA40E380_9PEZI|nr:ribonuclease H-like domain-containing protein [Lasiosphaeris hirsuta]
MDSSQYFKTLRETVQAALVTTTRTVNRLANEDLQFQRTANPGVGNHLDEKSERLLKLAGDLLKSAGNATGQRVSTLEDVDDVDIHWRGIVDVIDSLLEKADTCLDEYTGMIKRKDAPTPDAGRDSKRTKSTNSRLDWSLKRANILKPQDAFEKKVNNFDSGAWKPLLTTKPHARLSLEESLVTFVDEENNTQYRHPYEHEILSMQYPSQVYEKREPEEYLPVETTTAIWVDTFDGVLEMLAELKQATEIALDLEHHDFRSYTGLLSLMQISTREKDWIVDTLVPWRHKLEVLNEVFADPNIVKVLHGAFMDAIWLQRDLGLYVVGLFDTHHACDILGYPGKSLAFLLKKFVDFDADKKYQLADWRIRPLPDEMFYYARSDTHYLLYIYDMVRNELVERSNRSNPEQDLIEMVVQKSKEVSLQRYENTHYDGANGYGSRGWYNTLLKSPTLYDGEQFAVYKALHQWRDETARRKDESTSFIISQQVLSDVARLLPADPKALWSLLDSNARTLKVNLEELFALIQKAKASGANGPKMMDIFRRSPGALDKPAKAVPEVNANAPAVEELRTGRSQLWGDIAMSSVWDESTKAVLSNEKLEVLPTYHQFIQEASSSAAAAKEPQNTVASEPPAAMPTPGKIVDKEFTLKGGHKRKIDDRDAESEAEAESGSNHDMDLDELTEPEAGLSDVTDVADDDEDGDQSSDEEEVGRPTKESKAARKLRRAVETEGNKEAKKLEKEAKAEAKRLEREKKVAANTARAAKKTALEQQAAEAKEGEEEDEERPFDYGKAESVLHPPRAHGKEYKGKKTFNPYTNKSGNAPKGARKLGHVKAGKTATFKK